MKDLLRLSQEAPSRGGGYRSYRGATAGSFSSDLNLGLIRAGLGKFMPALHADNGRQVIRGGGWGGEREYMRAPEA